MDRKQISKQGKKIKTFLKMRVKNQQPLREMAKALKGQFIDREMHMVLKY